MIFRIFTICLILFPAVVSSAQSSYEPGKTAEFPCEGLPKSPLIYLPENYSQSQTWPVIFHYHGTGGNPTVDIPLAYTGGRDFIIIGMPYITQGQKRPKRDYLEQELDFLKALRTRLITQFRIDPERSYVGGFSKGGWFGSEYAESMMSEFAGAYMLGAGWIGSKKRPAQRIAYKKPIYIGIGQLDGNQPHSIAAIQRFKELGASITFDEYLLLGHSIPKGVSNLSEYFTQWFQIESARPAINKLKAPVRIWAEKKTTDLENIITPLDRYLFIEHLRGAPFFRYLNQNQRKPFEHSYAEAIKIPDVRVELAIKKEYLDALTAESKAHDIEAKYAALLKSWAIYQDHPDTHYGKRSAIGVMRMRPQVLAVQRWNWPNSKSRQAFIEKLNSNPLPFPDESTIKPEFKRLQKLLR